MYEMSRDEFAQRVAAVLRKGDTKEERDEYKAAVRDALKVYGVMRASDLHPSRFVPFVCLVENYDPEIARAASHRLGTVEKKSVMILHALREGGFTPAEATAVGIRAGIMCAVCASQTGKTKDRVEAYLRSAFEVLLSEILNETYGDGK